MRRVLAGLAILQVLAIVGQFFLAASGAFDPAPNDESFQPHRLLGGGIILLAVGVTTVAAIARMPGRLIGMSGLVAGLTVVQFMIGAIATALDGSGGSTLGRLVFGLHAVNGLAILMVAVAIARRTGPSSRPDTLIAPAP